MKEAQVANYTIYKDGGKTVCHQAFPDRFVLEDASPGVVLEQCLELLRPAGGRITLGPGEFELDRTLRLGGNVTVCGQGKATQLAIRSAEHLQTGLLIDTVDDVTVRELAIVNKGGSADAGVIIDHGGSCLLKDLLIVGFTRYGIWLRNNAFLSKVDGCEVADNRETNIFLDHLSKDGRYGDFLPTNVTNCIVYGGGKGIEADNALVTNITGCSIYQTHNHAIHLHSVSNSVLVSGCRTFQITGHAVLVENSDELNVSSNIFCWHTGSGIVARNAAWGTVSANEFIDNGSFNPGGKNNEVHFKDLRDSIEPLDGVVLENVSGYSLSHNTIFNWNVCPKMRHGIFEDAQSYNNVIADNVLNFYEGEAVVSQGANTSTANNVGRADIPYTNLIGDTEKAGEKQFEATIIQSFQKELLEEYIRRNY